MTRTAIKQISHVGNTALKLHNTYKYRIQNEAQVLSDPDLFLKLESTTPTFQIQNRRFLGNKFKLLKFIEQVINLKCPDFNSFCDIFAGTGVVGSAFNKKNITIISNDLLSSNYTAIYTFLASQNINIADLTKKLGYLNSLHSKTDNYFSKNYGGTFFTIENARKIEVIREEINCISENLEEKNALLTSLLYACDKVANTVGHYDAFRKNLDSTANLQLLLPKINVTNNANNQIHNQDANKLIREIECDVLYIDPPYNSRQYCDTYHLLENLITWEKPTLNGKAKKMDRNHLKSQYCFKNAAKALEDLIKNAKCKHILISYNNTGNLKNGRSNARISDKQIMEILREKGKVEIFECDYKSFTTGKSEVEGNVERIFYCKVNP